MSYLTYLPNETVYWAVLNASLKLENDFRYYVWELFLPIIYVCIRRCLALFWMRRGKKIVFKGNYGDPDYANSKAFVTLWVLTWRLFLVIVSKQFRDWVWLESAQLVGWVVAEKKLTLLSILESRICLSPYLAHVAVYDIYRIIWHLPNCEVLVVVVHGWNGFQTRYHIRAALRHAELYMRLMVSSHHILLWPMWALWIWRRFWKSRRVIYSKKLSGLGRICAIYITDGSMTVSFIRTCLIQKLFIVLVFTWKW